MVSPAAPSQPQPPHHPVPPVALGPEQWWGHEESNSWKSRQILTGDLVELIHELVPQLGKHVLLALTWPHGLSRVLHRGHGHRGSRGLWGHHGRLLERHGESGAP